MIDGGVGMVQMRHAQNAADFASVAASQLMPCSVNANQGVTGSQVQKTVQTIIDDNLSAVTTSWSAKYLDASGNPISGATFTGATAMTPPATACGVAVQVTGSWGPFVQHAGYNSIAASGNAGAVGTGSQGYNLAIASLLPYARHTIYAGAVGTFTVNGSMYDNSVAQCNDRLNSCKNYPSCLSGTPLNNIICYGDSADVFQQSSEAISGTLYSVAPVAVDPCFYPSPTSGVSYPMAAGSYPQYYYTYYCNSQFSTANNPVSYSGIQGNVAPIVDPLAALSDPSANGGVATICPGQTSVQTSAGGTFSSGTLTPGVYTSPVVITGSVTLLPCQSAGTTTGPGIYVFQQGIEICPTAGSTVTGNNVTLFSVAAPPSTYSNTKGSAYCASARGPGGTVTDGIEVGGAPGATVNITAPSGGPFESIAFYQSRSNNFNIGLDDGWNYSGGTYTANGASITINGVVYDNSYTNEPSGLVFSSIQSQYTGPYASLCTGATSQGEGGDPVPCPGIPRGLPITNTSGSVTINGAVIVGGFGTQGGSTSNPLTLTISFNPASVPSSVSGVRLIY
jgi:hypothetical protein